MSTTFWCPSAPRHRGDVPCRMPGCSAEDRCGYCKDGTEYIDEAEDPTAECNFSSGNAASVLRLLDLWDPEGGEPTGTLQVKDIPPILERIGIITSDFALRAPCLSPPSSEGGPGTGCPRIISFGVTDDDLLRRLFRVKSLLNYALKNNFHVSWG